MDIMYNDCFILGSNPSGSEDEAATVDDDIRSSSSSGNDGGRNGGGEESGIGTASPPPRQRKDLDKGMCGFICLGIYIHISLEVFWVGSFRLGIGLFYVCLIGFEMCGLVCFGIKL